ncbi:MAG: mitochondrial fission ELM1 family protein [Kiritimatiellae bacterium]|nr:mitochondrial fission ELM1 family protein [Kiritimatiellia bacterium]
MKALILTDGKAGHENQSKAFARSIGCDFDILPVRFKSKPAKALSYLLDNIGIRTTVLFDGLKKLHKDSSYDLVIGTGSGTFYPAKTAGRILGIPCGVVLLPSGYHIKSFDCILAPEFDNPPPLPNVVKIPVNLVSVDQEFYKSGIKAFQEKHACNAQTVDAAAIIIGGPNKCAAMSPEWMKAQLDGIFSEHKAANREIWVTTSRRTPPEVEKVVESYPFDYKLIYSKDQFNPIPAFVSLASHLYVTAESTGMLSEACSFGKAQVHVLDNLNPGLHKFRRFAQYCSSLGNRKIDLSESFSRAKKLLKIG